VALARKSDCIVTSQAESADINVLYQESVQDVEAEIDFVEETWSELRKRPAELLREDFCGTANTACEWTRRDENHYAIGVDLDEDVLQWGELNNISQLSVEEQARISLVHDDVASSDVEIADIVLAMNFSYYLLMERAELLEYFESVHAGLAEDGIFFLDAYGGYDAPRVLEEERECDGFTYIWDQASFNPIDSRMNCKIHYAFPDGSRIDGAFDYYWRLWTLPEIRELLDEAGFSQVDIYWEGTDEESGEGNGIFEPAESGDPDPGWVCYIVAQV